MIMAAACPESRQAEFRQFALEHVLPYATEHDVSERLSADIVDRLSRQGYLAPFIPPSAGGAGMDMVTYGALHEEIGRACSSVRSILTVHDMVALAILRWGTEDQRRRWLPELTSGRVTASFAISEPDAGSDLNGVQTWCDRVPDGFLLNGCKKWITGGQISGLFLVLAKLEGRLTAFLVEKDAPGLTVTPIHGMSGTRGSMLALLTFNDCRIPRESVIGQPGFGANTVVQNALGLGRYSVACGSVGIAQACLDACLEYASTKHRSGSPLKEFQLIQQMITDIVAEVAAARLLCRCAGTLKDEKDPQELLQTFIAKYHASLAAANAANRAVQIHGANGCSAEFPVERLLRDARITEIIEGSNQIQQITIAKLAFQEFERRRRSAPRQRPEPLAV